MSAAKACACSGLTDLAIGSPVSQGSGEDGMLGWPHPEGVGHEKQGDGAIRLLIGEKLGNPGQTTVTWERLGPGRLRRGGDSSLPGNACGDYWLPK